MLEAALRDGTAARPSVFELFSRRLSGGRRFGVVAGTGRLLSLLRDFRFGDDELRFLRDANVVDAPTLALPRGLPVPRHDPRLPGGRALLPRIPDPHRRRDLRRRGDPGDPRAQRAQPRLRGRDRRLPDEHRGRRAPARGDGIAARGRATPPSPRPVPRSSPASGRPATWRPVAPGASPRWARRRTPGRCCTTARRTRSAPRSPPSAPARHCSWTPTTSVRAWRPRSGSPAPDSAACGSTPATCRPSQPPCGSSSTSSARPAPGSR